MSRIINAESDYCFLENTGVFKWYVTSYCVQYLFVTVIGLSQTLISSNELMFLKCGVDYIIAPIDASCHSCQSSIKKLHVSLHGVTVALDKQVLSLNSLDANCYLIVSLTNIPIHYFTDSIKSCIFR